MAAVEAAVEMAAVVVAADAGSRLLHACAAGDSALVQSLLAGGAPASYQDSAGVSALMLASASASTAIISTLLEAGAPWNALDRQGRCAGEYAVESQSQECCDVLVAAGVRAQLLFGLLEDATTTDDRTTARYLASDVQMSADGKTLADADGDAVMMEWERPLMEAHADVLCGRFDHSWIAALDVSPDEGTFAVLNVGHGMGIIDNFIQDRLAANAKATHTIIEPHDGVLASMRLQGWLAKPGVAVSAATWQAAFLDPAFGPFDAIFFDTYVDSLPPVVRNPEIGTLRVTRTCKPFSTCCRALSSPPASFPSSTACAPSTRSSTASPASSSRCSWSGWACKSTLYPLPSTQWATRRGRTPSGATGSSTRTTSRSRAGRRPRDQ